MTYFGKLNFDILKSSNNFHKCHVINFSSASKIINMVRKDSKILFMAWVITAGFKSNKSTWNALVEPGRTVQCTLMSFSCGPVAAPKEHAMTRPVR